MSLHYLLDGYNIIHKSRAGLQGKLEDQRSHLIRYIEETHPQGSAKNKVTIVFDGRSDVFGSSHSGDVMVTFSKDETADRKIRRIVKEDKNAKQLVVVTDDRSLQYAVRALGAKVSSVGKFLENSKLRGLKQDKNKQSSPGKNITKTMEYKITTEMEDVWLKKRKK